MIKDVRIGFTAGTGLISWAIRWVDRATVDEKRVPSSINHVLIRVIYHDGMDFVFQSHGKGGVGICFTNDVKEAISHGKVFRYAEKSLGLSYEHAQMAIHRMQTFTGSGYDYFAILMYYIGIAMRVQKASGVHESGRYTCNEAVIRILAGMNPWANPDRRPTPEPLFETVFQCPSPVYFENNPAIPLDFWP